MDSYIPLALVISKVNTLCYCAIATPVSYTHLRAHETCADLVCRLLLEKKYLLEISFFTLA
ncbi:hypothetical protein JMUB7525_27560 [Staphylococcus aureus]